MLGTGANPSALTGREPEQAVLRRCLAELLGGASPPHDIVLTALRGTGRTVLLNRCKRACRYRATEVDVAAPLAETLGPPPGMTKLLPRVLAGTPGLAAHAQVVRSGVSGEDGRDD